MATTVQQSFLKLKSNLEITDLQASTVSTRQEKIREVMQAGIDVLDSFLTGSYARSTMIAPLKQADIDIFFCLDVRYYTHYNGPNGGPAGLLDFVKRTLQKTYPQTPGISRNGQAVTITFTDFVVDVVPGFYRQGGGFLIPNSITGSWLSTDPKKHVELMTAANKAHNGDLVPLIKMIKGWNKLHSEFFSSFHLEVLALQIFDNIKITDFPSGARYYFDKAREFVKKQNLDPAGYGDDVGKYISGDKVAEAVQRFQTSYDRAVRAEDFASRGRDDLAIEMWQKIFDAYFPAYG
jgi:hypothetical protein